MQVQFEDQNYLVLTQYRDVDLFTLAYMPNVERARGGGGAVTVPMEEKAIVSDEPVDVVTTEEVEEGGEEFHMAAGHHNGGPPPNAMHDLFAATQAVSPVGEFVRDGGAGAAHHAHHHRRQVGPGGVAPTRTRRAMREKVVCDQGYVYTADKDSVCGTRRFWRCERKSDCNARLHTDPRTGEIVRRMNNHSHEPDTAVLQQLQTADLRDSNVVVPVATKKRKGNLSVIPTISGNSPILLESADSPPIYVPPVGHILEVKSEMSDGGSASGGNGMTLDADLADLVARIPTRNLQMFVEMPDTFWRIFAIAKDIYDSAKDELLQSGELQSTSQDPNSLGRRSVSLRIFIGRPKEDEELIYQQVTLAMRTERELVKALKKKKLIDSNIDIVCVCGQGGINIKVEDHIVETFSNDSVFQISATQKMAKLVPIKESTLILEEC